jgi:chaperone protein DnaJ
LLVNGAEMPAEDDLPAPLKPLAHRQAFELTVRHWANDVSQLVKTLKRAPGFADVGAIGGETTRRGAKQGAKRDEEERAAKDRVQPLAPEEKPRKEADERARSKGEEETRRGADLRYNLEISLEEAARGTEAEIRIPALEECETCHGSGAKPGTQLVSCPMCGGQGQVRIQQGFFPIQQTCPKCHGSGRVVPTPCATCQGAGRVRRHKTLSVQIPAGVDEGNRIRLSGEGEASMNGGPPGDLYVVINVKPHSLFQREGLDLHCEMPVSLATAALGGEIEIPTLDGRAKIQIPAETRTGQVFRLRGKGIKQMDGKSHGDLFCHIAIENG